MRRAIPCLALLACGSSGSEAPDASFDAANRGDSGGSLHDATPSDSPTETDGRAKSDGHASDGAPTGEGGSSDGMTPPGTFPGQAGNPVGYQAAPGCSGGLKVFAGGSEISAGGTASSPKVYSCLDFVAGTGGTLISGSHLKFVGCRFQSNDLENYNVQVTGSDVSFEYSSVTPLVSLASAPPHPAWPSGGAGKQLVGNGTGYQIGGDSGYEYGFNLISGGPVTIDHCDIWGFGNAVVFMSTTTAMTVQNTWIHDAADAAAQGYHTDGPGYLNGGGAPQNVSILNNTIASIGNTNAIALQAVSSPYMNITMTGNYLSGFGYTADVGHEASGSTHMTFTDNTFGTDLPWVYGPVYGDETTLYGQPTNTWHGNKLEVLTGTSPINGAWTWMLSDDGKFIWPDTSAHSSDF
jgi:hypothetical protein